MESLSRQGAQNMSRPGAELGFGLLLRWDAQAEAFTLDAHQIRQSPEQILAALHRAGYGATAQDVGASISDRQGCGGG